MILSIISPIIIFFIIVRFSSGQNGPAVSLTISKQFGHLMNDTVYHPSYHLFSTIVRFSSGQNGPAVSLTISKQFGHSTLSWMILSIISPIISLFVSHLVKMDQLYLLPFLSNLVTWHFNEWYYLSSLLSSFFSSLFVSHLSYHLPKTIDFKHTWQELVRKCSEWVVGILGIESPSADVMRLWIASKWNSLSARICYTCLKLICISC